MSKEMHLLMAKAAADEALLKKLQDPKLVRTVLKEHGIDVSKIPEHINIQFIQEPLNTKIIVISNPRNFKNISGGTCNVANIVGTCGGA